MRIRMILAYHGAGFHGFAAQPGIDTVAGALGGALALVLRLPEPPAITCAGRTDAGVHAWGQNIHVDIPDPVDGLDVVDLHRRLVKLLAPRVVVRALSLVGEDWDARHSARFRSYRYTVLNRPLPDPFLHGLVWLVAAPLDRRALDLACDPLIGEHDFSSFCRKLPAPRGVAPAGPGVAGPGARAPAPGPAAGPGAAGPGAPAAGAAAPGLATGLGAPAPTAGLAASGPAAGSAGLGAPAPGAAAGSTGLGAPAPGLAAGSAGRGPATAPASVRGAPSPTGREVAVTPVSQATLVRRVLDAHWVEVGDGVLRLDITATAFCQQMVRSVVGTLVDIGLGRRKAGEMTGILRARDRAAAGTVAPPEGLCLWEVGYPTGEG